MPHVTTRPILPYFLDPFISCFLFTSTNPCGRGLVIEYYYCII